MRNSILIALQTVWSAKPQNITFAGAINSFLSDFERIFEVDNLLPSLAGKMFESYLMQFDADEKQTESKKAPFEQIEQKQNDSFICECGAKFSTVQARSGHKKKCKL